MLCGSSIVQYYLGTWQVAPSDGFWTDQDISESEKVISLALKLGISGFDTAQSYGKGRSEQTLAKVLRRTNNQDIIIDTKIMPSTKRVSEILKVSLTRLAPYSINCLYLHWPRSGFDNTSFLKEMAILKNKNQISKVGICNMPLEDLKKTVRDGFVPDRIQIPLSLLWTRDLSETKSFCNENKIQICAYSPTGMGLLSGKYKESKDLHDARKDMFCFKENCHKQFLDLLETLKKAADTHKTSCTKTALAWTVAQNPDIILIGARNTEQLQQNLSDQISLTETELSDLTTAAQKLDVASRSVCTNIFSYRW